MEKNGIKECLELLNGLEIVGVAVGKTVKDGKINAADLPHVMELINNFNVILEAVKGINELPAEVKDLDQAELLALGGKAYEVVKSIIDAVKA